MEGREVADKPSSHDGSGMVQISKQRVEIAQLLRGNGDDISTGSGCTSSLTVRNHCAEMELLYRSGDLRKSCENRLGQSRVSAAPMPYYDLRPDRRVLCRTG